MKFDIGKLSLNYEKQFYLLKHFTAIDTDFRKELMSRGDYTIGEIQAQLNFSGSKFNQKFACNPNELLNQIKRIVPCVNLKVKESGNRIYLNFEVTKELFNREIGTDNIIAIDKLTAKQKSSIFKQGRDEFEPMHIEAKGIPTRELNVVLADDSDLNIVTIFPGIFAPPLPNLLSQTPKDYSLNQRFWESHAFLVSYSNPA